MIVLLLRYDLSTGRNVGRALMPDLLEEQCSHGPTTRTKGYQEKASRSLGMFHPFHGVAVLIAQGTCPGLNFAYAHTNQLISKYESQEDCPQFVFLTGVSFCAPCSVWTELTSSLVMVLLPFLLPSTWRVVSPDSTPNTRCRPKVSRPLSTPSVCQEVSLLTSMLR
jgi:hypothetical protein